MYYTAKCESSYIALVYCYSRLSAAKKEDTPEQALKEFKAIVDQEEEKGDW